MKPLVNERKHSYFYGFGKIVHGCTDYGIMLPMNMGLSTNKY